MSPPATRPCWTAAVLRPRPRLLPTPAAATGRRRAGRQAVAPRAGTRPALHSPGDVATAAPRPGPPARPLDAEHPPATSGDGHDRARPDADRPPPPRRAAGRPGGAPHRPARRAPGGPLARRAALRTPRRHRPRGAPGRPLPLPPPRDPR